LFCLRIFSLSRQSASLMRKVATQDFQVDACHIKISPMSEYIAMAHNGIIRKLKVLNWCMHYYHPQYHLLELILASTLANKVNISSLFFSNLNVRLPLAIHNNATILCVQESFWALPYSSILQLPSWLCVLLYIRKSVYRYKNCPFKSSGNHTPVVATQ